MGLFDGPLGRREEVGGSRAGDRDAGCGVGQFVGGGNWKASAAAQLFPSPALWAEGLNPGGGVSRLEFGGLRGEPEACGFSWGVSVF